MKVQILLSLLPLLTRLAFAVPTTKPASATTISPVGATSVAFPIRTPLPLPDDRDDGSDAPLDDGPDDPNAPLIEDEEAASDLVPATPAFGGLEKRKNPTSLNWKSNPNIKFRVGRNINVEVDLTLHSTGKVRYYTRVNNRRRWGPYKYAIACAVTDKAKRAYTFDRTGKVCRRARACHVDVKDTTVTNQNIKKYWQDILKGDKILICQATASWNVGKVANLVLKWFKDNKEGVIAVIAIISAVAAAA